MKLIHVGVSSFHFLSVSFLIPFSTRSFLLIAFSSFSFVFPFLFYLFLINFLAQVKPLSPSDPIEQVIIRLGHAPWLLLIKSESTQLNIPSQAAPKKVYTSKMIKEQLAQYIDRSGTSSFCFFLLFLFFSFPFPFFISLFFVSLFQYFF